MRSATILALAASAGLTAAANAQPINFGGTGDPAASGFVQDQVPFQFDTPSTGFLTLDTSAGSGFLPSTRAVYTISTTEQVEIVDGYTIEWVLELLPGNEQTWIIVDEAIQPNPAPIFDPNASTARYKLVFEGSGPDAQFVVRQGSDPDLIIEVPADELDLSGQITMQVLRRPAIQPQFPELYLAEPIELYVNGTKVNTRSPVNGSNLLGVQLSEGERVIFGDFARGLLREPHTASRAVIDSLTITPGPSSLPVLGACCLGMSQCETLTSQECSSRGGEWDRFSGCVPGRLSEDFGCLTGACCLADGTCEEVDSLDDCISLFGVWQGDGVTCQEVECQPLDTACCYDTGGFIACSLVLTEEECLSGDISLLFGDGIVADRSALIPRSECAEEFGSCTIPEP